MINQISRIIDTETRGGTKIIFLHHSTGRLLLLLGRVRNLLKTKNEEVGINYELWDHDYNRMGLTGPTGKRLNVSFEIPQDNTDPDGLDVLFAQEVHNPADNALSYLLKFNVVIFKSCFPVSAIKDESQLKKYQNHYRHLRQTIASHPNILFIAMTPPPLIPKPFPGYPASASTNAEEATRARKFANWLKSDDFCMGAKNIAVFDLFNLLAESDLKRKDTNMLKRSYRSLLGFDSHPNLTACRTMAPMFTDFVFESVHQFSASFE